MCSLNKKGEIKNIPVERALWSLEGDYYKIRGNKELTWREHLRDHRLTGSEKRPGDSAENRTPVYEVEAFTFQDLVGPWSEFCHFGGFSPSFDFYKAANKGAQSKHWCWVTRNRLRYLPSPLTWMRGGRMKSLSYSNGSQLIWFRNTGEHGANIFNCLGKMHKEATST